MNTHSRELRPRWRRAGWTTLGKVVLKCALLLLPAVSRLPAADCLYRIEVDAGKTAWIANQGANDQTVSNLFGNPPLGTRLQKFDNLLAQWVSNVFDRHVLTNKYGFKREWTGWRFERQTLAPGEGAYIYHQDAALDLCIPAPANTQTHPLDVFTNCPGCFLLSAQTPVPAAEYEDIAGFPPEEGSLAYQWNVSSQTTRNFRFTGGQWFEGGNPSPTGPRAGVGEPLWICPRGGAPPATALCSYTLTLAPGYNLIANQCRNYSTVAALLPAAPFGTRLMKFDNRAGRYEPVNAFSTAWSHPQQTLAPGEGAWLYNPSGQNVIVTVSGSRNTPVLPLPYAASGCYLVSCQEARPGSYEAIMGVSPAEGAQVYRWIAARQVWSMAEYSADLGWEPEVPASAVGEAVWICSSGRMPPAVPPVSFYTVTVQPALNLIANQCANNNLVATLFPRVPDGSQLVKWDGANRRWTEPNFFASRLGWSDPAQLLVPGEGAFLFNPTPAPFDLFIAGQPQVPQLPLRLTAGFNVVSRQTNAPGGYGDIVGAEPLEGSVVYRWNVSAQQYSVATYFDGGWDPEEPVAGVGEAVIVWPPAAAPLRDMATAAPGVILPPVSVCSYSLTLQPGWNLIANQCANRNTVAWLLPDMPEGTQLVKWNQGAQSYDAPNLFTADPGWNDPSQSLAPGEGAWLFNPETTSFRITITGGPNVPSLPLALAGGLHLVSRQTNAPGGYRDIVVADPPEGTIVYRWNASARQFSMANFMEGLWLPEELVAGVGEALWIALPGAQAPTPPPLRSLTKLSIRLLPCYPGVALFWDVPASQLESSEAVVTPTPIWSPYPGSSPLLIPMKSITQDKMRFFRLKGP